MLLGLAVLAGAGPTRVRVRAGAPAPVAQRRRSRNTAEPLALAANLDLLAVCLAAGMAVSHAAAVTAAAAPPRLAAVLQRAADLLALGADPDIAWAPLDGPPDRQLDTLLRLARRSAHSGAALADAVVELAAQCREDVTQTAAAAAERAGVLIAGPLGLCFLPAFVCLGIVPAVAGLAGQVLQSGLLW